MSVVLFRFLPGENRDVYLQSVPARDVTLADWDQLEDEPKKLLLSHARAADGLYEQVMTVDEGRKTENGGGTPAPKAAAKKGRGKKGEQLDPNVLNPGRVNADVLASGLAVPQTDEPIGEGAPGFSKSDTGPTNPQEG